MSRPILVALLCMISLQSFGRSSVEINQGWFFKKLDSAAQEAIQVNLPHTYNLSDGSNGGDDYFRGETLYSKKFINPCEPDETLFVEFSGVTLNAKILINKKLIGQHYGGYTKFRFKILTDTLQLGENNMEVFVDNGKLLPIAPLAGDFTVFGGITKNVNFICTKNVHFDLNDYGSEGVYLTPTIGAANAGKLFVSVNISNESLANNTTQFQLDIIDPHGKKVGGTAARVQLNATSTQLKKFVVPVNPIELWDGIHSPALYTAKLKLQSVNGEHLDELSIPFGFRTITINAQKGLMLNGRAYQAHGVNMHTSQHPNKGTAVSLKEEQEDFKMLDDLGVTALRLAHYPHAENIYHHADKMGYLIWTEIPAISKVDASTIFYDNLVNQLRELIKQNYNHPSVFVWGLGNEIYSADALAISILNRLNKIAKSEDPTRYTSYANCCVAVTHSIATQGDLNASNIYNGWYPDQKDDMSFWIDQAHQALNNRALAISEYGAGGSPLHQEDPPKRPQTNSHWHPEQYQSLVHENSWQAISSKPYLWASFVWLMFDVASDGRNEGDAAGINDKGLVTYDRKIKKDAYYWYQANWSKIPMAHITSKRYATRQESRVPLKVYTNLSRIIVCQNHGQCTPLAVSNRIATTQLQLQKGNNVIDVKDAAGNILDSAEWQFNVQ